jgi:hypothetical protein
MFAQQECPTLNISDGTFLSLPFGSATLAKILMPFHILLLTQ